ncbi:hypothetical protein SKAU_G00187090 [Synaphobranchus kaupii]|uniref:Uncharacterized protein n=1 Tax=Synaphobranchus kaupii TaxID=118154 RepID=A0A9Q1IX28_SYNKA|nr:hypothetical protein SKAU_G00187090 [Synaphobranchus kaupii]
MKQTDLLECDSQSHKVTGMCKRTESSVAATTTTISHASSRIRAPVGPLMSRAHPQRLTLTTLVPSVPALLRKGGAVGKEPYGATENLVKGL